MYELADTPFLTNESNPMKRQIVSLLTLSLLLAGFSAVASAETKDIVDTAVGAGKFKTLVAAVKAAGLVDTLKGKGPFTVFAPTDDAFAKIPKETIASLLKPENKDKLTAILTYHVVPGKVAAGDLLKVANAKTVQGSPVKFALTVENAKIIATDIECSNGVIHVIDSVIMPPEKMKKVSTTGHSTCPSKASSSLTVNLHSI